MLPCWQISHFPIRSIFRHPIKRKLAGEIILLTGYKYSYFSSDNWFTFYWLTFGLFDNAKTLKHNEFILFITWI